jgi:two-component system, sensor histidine kinase and response regulator
MPLPFRLDTTSSTGKTSIPALKPTLLIVDDEEGPRQSLKIVFKDAYNCLLANDAVTAIEIVRNNKINVAVFDILMGGMSGVELLKHVKDIDPTIEVIMLTAYETIETARQALRLGACDYLNKPFDIPTMRSAMARALEKNRIATEIHSTNHKLIQLQQEIQDQKLQEEMTRTKGEIYASVLHDINSPLTVISGFIEIISSSIENAASVEGEKLETIKGDLSRLNSQVARCFEISQRYLSFLRQGTKLGEIVHVGVNQILTDIRELLVRHPSAKNHQLHIQTLDQDIAAEINGTDFLQILLNLTINALQSTNTPHSVKIHGKLLPQPLDIAQFHDSPTERFLNRERFLNTPPILCISIEDNGPGISSENVAKLFETKFTTKPAGGGTGLGLHIVKRLINEAAGGIHVRTSVGQGTVFTIFLRTAQQAV